MKKLNQLRNTDYRQLFAYFGALQCAPTRAQGQSALFLLGSCLLIFGLEQSTLAQGLTTNYNETRIADSVNVLLTYLEGSFGALVMATAGIGAILSSAFGQYKASLGCLVVAVGSFILRSFMATFFNDSAIME